MKPALACVAYVGLAAAAVVLAACGGGESEGASRATATPRTTVEQAADATATTRPSATATRTVTTTPVPPTATPVPPTATPQPTSTPPPPPTASPVPPQPPAPTSPPPPTQPPPPPPPAASSLSLTAAGLDFSPGVLTAATGANVTITMSNQDTLVPHNVSISGVGTSATCQGPCTVSLSFTAPGPGNYTFICTIHPSMVGTLSVQ